LLDKILDHILAEWTVVRESPEASLLCFALGIAVAWKIASKHFEERFSVLTQRITDYQERLGIAPRDNTAYSKLTNKEVKERMLRLVESLRELHQRISAESKQAMDSMFSQIRQAKTAEESRAIRDRQIAGDAARRNTQDIEFAKFRTDANLLRDEARKRIPKQPQELIVALDVGMLAGINPSLTI
jgi:hypothetical protein